MDSLQKQNYFATSYSHGDKGVDLSKMKEQGEIKYLGFMIAGPNQCFIWQELIHDLYNYYYYHQYICIP